MTMSITAARNVNSAGLRRDLRHSDDADLQWRRSVVGLSLLGMAAMTPVVLLQTGLVRHLPDPPIKGFHSDAANLSASAFRFGVPDGALALASLALNVPLAAYGAGGRAKRKRWLPILAAGKAIVDAAGAGWYLYRMVSGKEPWCAYCITGAAANFGLVAATLPEASQAVRAER